MRHRRCQRQVGWLREAANSLPLTVKPKPFAPVINGPLHSRVVLAGTPGFCLLTPPRVRRPWRSQMRSGLEFLHALCASYFRILTAAAGTKMAFFMASCKSQVSDWEKWGFKMVSCWNGEERKIRVDRTWQMTYEQKKINKRTPWEQAKMGIQCSYNKSDFGYVSKYSVDLTSHWGQTSFRVQKKSGNEAGAYKYSLTCRTWNNNQKKQNLKENK